MAGTIRGTVDAFIDAPNEHYTAGEIFKLYFDALDAHTRTTRIAFYRGDGGSGTDYHDGASPMGNKAFAVWRFDTHVGRSWPFYVMIYTNSVTSGTSGGDWLNQGGGVSGSYGQVLVSSCVGIGGDENPWNGTTANNGLDTVGSPRWDTPAGGTGIIVSPATNRDGSEDTVLKNNCATAVSQSTAGRSRASIIMDDDSLILLADEYDNAAATRTMYIGMYEPFAHLTVPTPFVMVVWAGNLVEGNLSDETSAVTGVNQSTHVVNASMTKGIIEQPYSPAEIAGGGFTPHRIGLSTQLDAAERGILGTLPVTFRGIRGGTANSVTADLLYRAHGDGGRADQKVLVPWDGVTMPLSTFVREGVTF